MNWQVFPTRNPENIKGIPLIKLKRAYDKPAKADGYRILIDRLWPRGLTKEEAAIDEWAKDLAPTALLRNWFDHDPYYWEQFRKKYIVELKQNKSLDEFVERHKKKKLITLVYATKYDKLTHALVLQQVLEKMFHAG